MDGETILAILVGSALAVFSLMMVSYSFLRGSSTNPAQANAQSSETVQPSGEVGVGLDSIYDSINTLDLEYQLGNLPEEQYREQLRAYRLEAAAFIKAQLEYGEAPPDLLLEQEVMAVRAEIRSAESASEAHPELVEGWQDCPHCDAPIPAAIGLSNSACPHCGAHFSESGFSGFEDSQDAESC